MGQTWVFVAVIAGIVLIAIVLWQRASGSAKGNAAAPGKRPAPLPSAPKTTAKAPTAEPAAAPAAEAPKAAKIPSAAVPSVAMSDLREDDDDDITIVTLAPRFVTEGGAPPPLPDVPLHDDDDGPEEGAEENDKRSSAVPIIYDEEAATDEPTQSKAVILVSAIGQTDRGQKRKINEDRYLVLDDEHLYVVADGMGGHAGGEVASQLAVDTIERAFRESKFEGEPYADVPRRASDLALAIQMANQAIFERAKSEPALHGMGTTIVSARFTPGKQRVYIGHVGDSRCYRFRAGKLAQVTTDHTMAAAGMTGPFAEHLSRAVGIAPSVKVDLVIVKPRPDDVYILCSDGLSKMAKDEGIREVLAAHADPHEAVNALVAKANASGGRDNITVILVVVKDPRGFARYAQIQERKARKKAEEAGDSGPIAAENPIPAEKPIAAEKPIPAPRASGPDIDRITGPQVPAARVSQPNAFAAKAPRPDKK